MVRYYLCKVGHPRKLFHVCSIWHRGPTKQLVRFYSASASHAETVTVPCKSHGSITLSIHHSASAHHGSGVVLYLPPGPAYIPSTAAAFDDFAELAQSHLPSHAADTAVQEPRSGPSTAFAQALAQYSNLTVVQVNYRLSKTHQFPTPIHDVAAGFDYVASKLLPHNGEIGVCGELAGGSLALMLALTENRANSARIGHAVVHEPIVDWLLPLTSNESTASSKKRRLASKSSSLDGSTNTTPSTGPELEPQALTLSNLQTLRSMLFHPLKPATYFDPFASPIHFLRTSGATVPRPKGADDDFATLVDLADLTVEDETLVASRPQPQNPLPSSPNESTSSRQADHDGEYDDVNALDDLETPPPSPSTPQSPSQLQLLSRAVKPRKTRLRYPPPGHSLVIPQISISAAQSSALVPQLEEFTRLLQRAIVSGSPAAVGVKESTITELATAMGRGKDVEGFEMLKSAWAESEARLRLSVGARNRMWNVDGAGAADLEKAARAVGEEFKRMMSC